MEYGDRLIPSVALGIGITVGTTFILHVPYFLIGVIIFWMINDLGIPMFHNFRNEFSPRVGTSCSRVKKETKIFEILGIPTEIFVYFSSQLPRSGPLETDRRLR